MRSPADRTIFKASLERCIVNPAFLDDFYENFQAASAEVREKFKDTNFANQKFILRASMYIMETVADTGHPSQAFDDLAAKHDRNHYAIQPELYDIWLVCMLKSVSRFDTEFSAEIETAWKNTMMPGINLMKEKF